MISVIDEYVARDFSCDLTMTLAIDENVTRGPSCVTLAICNYTPPNECDNSDDIIIKLNPLGASMM